MKSQRRNKRCKVKNIDHEGIYVERALLKWCTNGRLPWLPTSRIVPHLPNMTTEPHETALIKLAISPLSFFFLIISFIVHSSYEHKFRDDDRWEESTLYKEELLGFTPDILSHSLLLLILLRHNDLSSTNWLLPFYSLRMNSFRSIYILVREEKNGKGGKEVGLDS